VAAQKVGKVLEEIAALFGFEDFGVGDFDGDFVSQEEIVEELFLKEVFTAFLVVVGPVAGEAVSDFQGVEASEEAIAGVLGGGGQDGVKELLFGNVVVGG
jgi:hypothetical protein